MEEPPILLDGARVIEYAVVDPSVDPRGRLSFAVGGLAVDLASLRGLVIAENLVEGGVFLLHCDERWQTLAAGYYASADTARESAQQAYGALVARWEPLHELSAEEQAEVETVRSHLREMAAFGDEPGHAPAT